jgi:hypothetical protein
MSNASTRELRARWYQSLRDGEQCWAERRLADADRCFRRAFNQAKKIGRKTSKPDLSVEITLKTMAEFHLSCGNYYALVLYRGLTWLWYFERWLGKRRGAR